MKQFTINGLNMLERFLEFVGQRVVGGTVPYFDLWKMWNYVELCRMAWYTVYIDVNVGQKFRSA